MKSFKEEQKIIDGNYQLFADLLKEDGLSVEGEIYLVSIGKGINWAETRRQAKINLLLSYKPFAPQTQTEIFETDNRVAMGMMVLKYNLNPDPERRLYRASHGMRRVYYSKQRFRNVLEIDFVKTADKKELLSYVHFNGPKMCEKAKDICRDVRNILV